LGMCAHVNYKEGTKNKKDDYLTKKISSLRQLLLNQENADNHDPLKFVLDKHVEHEHGELDEEEQVVDFGEFERIYVFSRDGDIIELPKGSTVLDFAYHVHTHVGNRA
ncbi:bifunctional (p)ppGpp synthetase/guanosine-3',5'-bis(diphosphate) 3'-pyrophosphohydrolase, partial [Mesorhizobium sp. M1C.F.Ca.ET.144.01.1.1]